MATITSAQSGNWTDGSTWVGGSTPDLTAADFVQIAAGHTVTIEAEDDLLYSGPHGDVNIQTGGTLVIYGSLTLVSQSMTFAANFFNSGECYVQAGGQLTQIVEQDGATMFSMYGNLYVDGEVQLISQAGSYEISAYVEGLLMLGEGTLSMSGPSMVTLQIIGGRVVQSRREGQLLRGGVPVLDATGAYGFAAGPMQVGG